MSYMEPYAEGFMYRKDMNNINLFICDFNSTSWEEMDDDVNSGGGTSPTGDSCLSSRISSNFGTI